MEGESGAGYLTNYTLTGGDNLPLVIDSTELTIQLNFADRNELKRLTDLATSRENTFLSITRDFIQDTSDNRIVPISFPQALQVSNFTEDRTPPSLLEFDLDMDARLLTLRFSETVSVDSLNVTQITLQGEGALVMGETQSYTLIDLPAPLGSLSDSENDSTIVIQIGESDANEIKFLTELALRTNNTFLSLTPFAIRDMNGNLLVEVSELNATRVSTYARDATGPVLRAFELDLTSETLSLSFDETVDFESLQASLITIHNSVNASESTFYPLIAAEPIGENSPLLVLNLTATQRDLNALKLLTDLATDPNNTFVTLSIGAVSDLSEIPNVIGSVTRAVDAYVPDLTSPEVVSFNVNINASTLTLVFDEVVNASSLDPTAIRLQNSTSLTPSYVDLTGE